MIKIKKISIKERFKISGLIDYIQSANLYKAKHESIEPFFPINTVHDLLPLNAKCLQETYVAVDEGEVLGLISLIPDGRVKTRWKISSLKLKEKNHDIAKQLVDFVVNKYGAIGVEIFLAIVEEKYPLLINLFKNGCGFRSCAKIQVWKSACLSKISCPYSKSDFRNFRDSDIDELLEINTSNLFTQFRPTLKKNQKDFKKAHLQTGKTDVFKVLEINGKVAGYFKLFSANDKEFWLELITELPYQDYYSDILGYAKDLVLNSNPRAVLYVYAKKYRQTYVRLVEILEENSFENVSDSQVLVKDYWKPLKLEDDIEEKSFMFFKDMTSPACF